MKLFKSLALKIQNYLNRFTKPFPDELVMKLILHTASLELKKDEYVELYPIRGCCGPFRLYGNSLPVFKYRVFEKEIMEFIEMRVEISKPDRIRFFSQIDSTTAPDLHGKLVETKEKYKEPFNQLSQHLYRYFPYYKKAG